MSQQPMDPRDKKIDELERDVAQLKLTYALQFGTDQVSGAIVTLLTSMSEDLKTVKSALSGDRPDGSDGLLVRLDRLEQAAKNSKWWTRVFAAACIAELAYILIHSFVK